MNRSLGWMFAAAALVGVLGAAVNLATNDWAGAAAALGLALVYGGLAIRPAFLSRAPRFPDDE